MSKTVSYEAVRITCESLASYEETRRRFEQHAPALDQAVTFGLVVESSEWDKVEAAVNARVGPEGFVSMARIDQGALLSLSGRRLEATLYLIGNPLIARRFLEVQAPAALYVPFRVAVFADSNGVALAYDQPSSTLTPLDLGGIDDVARELDAKIADLAEAVCAS